MCYMSIKFILTKFTNSWTFLLASVDCCIKPCTRGFVRPAATDKLMISCSNTVTDCFAVPKSLYTWCSCCNAKHMEKGTMSLSTAVLVCQLEI